ncbi:MAG: aminotransferase class V-fold PLP-dependent enzyme [Gemmatimonadetes bacterium]|nr:aminotransferase class V-fold PLP-dependent enzyme [Gemmatimonadota bacterium]
MPHPPAPATGRAAPGPAARQAAPRPRILASLVLNRDWRAEFPILARKTYLNSCSLGALSRTALARVAAFHDEWHEYGASAWYELWMGRLAELRERVARLLHARTDEVALTASVSAGLASFASALDYHRRPRVVVADLDFPTLAYAWINRPDVELVRVPSDDGFTIDPARFAAAVDERTALIATSHVCFTTGAIQPLRALAEIAHRNGALLLVDAYQSAGQVPIDVRADDIDVLLTGPLKWLLGGPGLAYIRVRSDLIPRLSPTVTGWFAARGQFEFDITSFEPNADARRFALGTPALPTVHSALGGQELIDELGVPAIRARNRALTAQLLDALAAAGMRVRGPARDDERRSAIVMIEHPDPAHAVAALARQDVIVDSRPGYVRVSPHFYNDARDIECFMNALRAAGT